MKVMKLQLLIIAFVLLIAGSAFASLSYDITINTSSLDGQGGYLYLQYDPIKRIELLLRRFRTYNELAAHWVAPDTAGYINGRQNRHIALVRASFLPTPIGQLITTRPSIR